MKTVFKPMRHPGLLSTLTDTQKKAVLQACRVLREAGFECYLVGGSVRDLLLGKSAKDLDLTSNASPEQSQRLFRRTIPTGIEHGTITLRLFGHSLELTTYRTESGYSDGRRPDRIEFGQTLSEDLKRRDFTVNALAYDPLREELLDEHEGMADLERRLIRTIGDPVERFFEDGLRPIRACRFLSTLEFNLENATAAAMRRPDVQKRTAMVAVERFSDELRKGMRAANPAPMIRELGKSGLLSLFLPDELRSADSSHLETSSESDAQHWNASLLSVSGTGTSFEELMARLGEIDGVPYLVDFRTYLWLRDLCQFSAGNFAEDRRVLQASPDLNTILAVLRRWKFPNHSLQCAAACQLLLEKLNSTTHLSAAETRFSMRKLLFELHRVLDHRMEPFLQSWSLILEYCTEFWLSAELLKELLDLRADPYLIKDLAVNGKDLMEAGINGKAVGETLQSLLQMVWTDPTRNNRDFLLSQINQK